MSELRDQFRKSIETKEDRTKTFLGYIGDGNGVVNVPGRNNFVWVTMSDGMVTQVYNTTVPPILNLPVVCGYDPRQKKGKLLCVLTVRNVERATQATTTQPLLSKHHASHEYLNTNDGTDVVWVELRQFTPLRPSIVAPYSIKIKRAVLQINGTWKKVGGVTVNLVNFIPTTQNPSLSGSNIMSRYAVVSIDKISGSPVATAGSLVPLPSLALTDIPAYPTGNYPVCAVRMYYYQTQFYEAATMTDLIDLRFSTMTTATSGVTLPQSTAPGAGYYLTGYDAISGSFSSGSVVSGSGVYSGSQVVPQSHTPVAGFYLTGYNAVSGSFSSGSMVSGSSGGGSFSGSHNELPGLQGASGSGYYHLTQAQHAIATQASGSGQAGYLTAYDWTRFYGSVSGSGAIGDVPYGSIFTYTRSNGNWNLTFNDFASARIAKQSFFEDFVYTDDYLYYFWQPPGAAGYSIDVGLLCENAGVKFSSAFHRLHPGGTNDGSGTRYRIEFEINNYVSGSVSIGISRSTTGSIDYQTPVVSEDGVHVQYLTVYETVPLHVLIIPASGSFSGTIKYLLINQEPVLPDSHAPVANYYLTGYDAVSGSFSSGSVTGGTSGSGGAQYLSDLLDVNIGSQTNGQALVWDEGSSKWIPGTVSGSGGTSGSQVVPLNHPPVAGFYITGYDNTTGSMTSGSIASSGSSGITDHTQLTSIGTLTHDQIDTALTRLAGTSGSNTGDQDLSDYLTDANSDGKTYGRKDGNWAQIISSGSGGGIEEAPIDGKTYGRNSGSWVEVVSGSATSGSGIPEAPLDGKQYGRQSGGWTEIVSGSGGGGTLGYTVIGVSGSTLRTEGQDRDRQSGTAYAYCGCRITPTSMLGITVNKFFVDIDIAGDYTWSIKQETSGSSLASGSFTSGSMVADFEISLSEPIKLSSGVAYSFLFYTSPSKKFGDSNTDSPIAFTDWRLDGDYYGSMTLNTGYSFPIKLQYITLDLGVLYI